MKFPLTESRPAGGAAGSVGLCSFISLVLQTNENLELTNGMQGEQHVKKELAKKLGQLQESIGDFKEQVSP